MYLPVSFSAPAALGSGVAMTRPPVGTRYSKAPSMKIFPHVDAEAGGEGGTHGELYRAVAARELLVDQLGVEAALAVIADKPLN